jgi:hypothetical protein
MLTAAVEGLLDQAVAQVIAPVTGHQIQRIYVTNGKSGLDNRLRGFNNATRFAPWFVLRDFDADAPCPGELQRTLLSSPSRYMCFRLAVPQIESWIMADRERFASRFSIRPESLPASPDTLASAKRALLSLVRVSRNKVVRSDMLPREDSGAREGPAYSSRLIEFVKGDWRPKVAARSSPSLASCLQALRVVSPTP